ncbi:MAG: hypothetical protein AABN33_11210 [Acidobacteriota bacterium]
MALSGNNQGEIEHFTGIGCYNGPMIRSHVVISGTGRAGTTFLVQLLTHLGLNTGLDVNTMELYPIARAGLEMDIRDANAPYIVKDPFLNNYFVVVSVDMALVLG